MTERRRRVALIHDHLGQDGGAERVLAILQEIYPDAPTYTMIHNPQRANPVFLKRDIRTSFLQRLPFGVRRYQWYLPWMPNAVERFDLSEYDLVISNSASFARGVLTLPRTLHIDYCHSPTRYLWGDTHRYVDELPYPRLLKVFIPFILTRIRQWDRLAADRVDVFFANSRNVQQRVQKYYRRDSIIMHPPVDTSDLNMAEKVGDYYLIGGRLVAYKRYDLAIRAFNRLGLRLKVFGSGPEEGRLRQLAKSNIEFLGRVNRAELMRLYRECLAFIQPQEEDFGITALEANASGRPVIAYAAGGALETVVPGKTGLFFDDAEWESLADTIIRWRPEEFNSAAIRAHAEQFSVERFKQRFRLAVEKAWQHHLQSHSELRFTPEH
ncbi:MAG: glycosyltransferase [Candidatus Kerfeldbacteria bacterium]|nr:glycosyltransferase [Candidatus Kerfeldbacteria bacterium]